MISYEYFLSFWQKSELCFNRFVTQVIDCYPEIDYQLNWKLIDFY